MVAAAKATDEQILAAYSETRSVWRAGERLGICGQSVHERLTKLGANKPINHWTANDDAVLLDRYEAARNDGNLKKLAESLGRTKHFICRQARRLGLTSPRVRMRSHEEKIRFGSIMSIHAKRRIREKGHPRGMLGKKHSSATISVLSEASVKTWHTRTDEQNAAIVLQGMKTRERNGTLYMPRKGTTWKAGWREIGGVKKYYRSRWEANYARYLDLLKQHGEIKEWLHEPETFWFEKIQRGCRSYLPDFRIVQKNDSVEYHEVKGYMDDRSKTKIKRMAKYHPKVKLIVIEAKSYRAIEKSCKPLIKDWE